MAETRGKSLSTPEHIIEFPNVRQGFVDLGDLTVGRIVLQPGWRWSKDVGPTVGGEWCQARHVGVIVSGRMAVDHPDGSVRSFGPDDVYVIEPGHDGYTVGDEPCVAIEWAGVRAFGGFRAGTSNRVLLTLLMTDVVDSTPLVASLGDVAWREVLSQHFESARHHFERFGGREVNTTGDGLLATFPGGVPALHCAAAILASAEQHGIGVRAGVHVGEVELVGNDVRGVAVHEVARIMGAADGGEVIVSETTRNLSLAAGLTFDNRGVHALKGLPGEWHLYAYVAGDAPGAA